MLIVVQLDHTPQQGESPEWVRRTLGETAVVRVTKHKSGWPPCALCGIGRSDFESAHHDKRMALLRRLWVSEI